MNELEKLLAAKTTENGDKAYNTTGDNLTDLFFMTAYFEKHLDEAHIGDSEKEKVFSMFVRDPRFGLGRRALGRELMKQSKVTPENVVKAGRYDDLIYNPTDANMNYYKEHIAGNELAKKWLPRLTGKNKLLAKAICKMWGLRESSYRKLIKTKTTEHKLSYAEKDENGTPLNELFHKDNYKHPLVEEINFEEVPSLAMKKYLHCFSTREDLKGRFEDYIGKVKEKKAKMNVKTANVHDAHQIATAGGFVAQSVEDIARETMAEKVVDNATLNVELNAIVILDTSGSMYWDGKSGDRIGDKATSVAYAISTKSTYAPNQLISFSSFPQLLKIHGETMREKYHSMYTGDCSNTDFGKVMEILRGLKKFPEYLVVLTDMEFDAGSNQSKKETMRLFKEAGANTKIIWWNFNDRNRTSIEIDEYGNFYLSGYNLQLLKLLENGMNMTSYIEKVLVNYCKQIGYEVKF